MWELHQAGTILDLMALSGSKYECLFLSVLNGICDLHMQCNKRQGDDGAISNPEKEEVNGQVVSAYLAMLLLSGLAKLHIGVSWLVQRSTDAGCSEKINQI